MDATPEFGSEAIFALRGQGSYREAIRRARDAVGRWEAVRSLASDAAPDAGDRVLAAALVDLGRLLGDFGEYDEAGGVLDRAARVSGTLADGGQLAGLAGMLRARAIASQGRIAEANRLVDDAMAMRHRATDPESIEILALAATIRLDGERLDDAESLARRAVAAADPLRDRRARERARAVAYQALGSIERVRGAYAAAEGSLRVAIDAAEAGFGQGSVELGGALNDLGMTFKFAGRFDEAEGLYRRALSLFESAFGTEHPDVAALYHNLGGLAHVRGDQRAAEPLARMAVEIRARTMGIGHPSTALDRAALAAILDAVGQTTEAEAILQEALQTLVEAFGPTNLEVAVQLNNLGAIARRNGDLAEAERCFAEAVRIKEQILGPASPALALTVNNLATVQRARGRTREAAESFRRALALLDGAVEADHPNLLAIRRNLTRLEARRPAPNGADP